MERRSFFLAAASGLVMLGMGTRPAAAQSGPLEMQWGYGPGYGWRRRRWGRPYGFYGPRPWGPRPWGPPMRRCWINRWGERVCRF
jgi:hypothetical protein